MSGEYERPAAAPGGLRLHLNENTAGCSPAVTEVLAALSPEDIAFYPDYDEAWRAAAAAVGVPADWLLLTNGLDEGILAATVAAVRGAVAGDWSGRPEVVVALPASSRFSRAATSGCPWRASWPR
jgi:histidinol-phosphate/aromatic aminotransferase/cobyric acid decarboxylase-like protein